MRRTTPPVGIWLPRRRCPVRCAREDLEGRRPIRSEARIDDSEKELDLWGPASLYADPRGPSDAICSVVSGMARTGRPSATRRGGLPNGRSSHLCRANEIKADLNCPPPLRPANRGVRRWSPGRGSWAEAMSSRYRCPGRVEARSAVSASSRSQGWRPGDGCSRELSLAGRRDRSRDRQERARLLCAAITASRISNSFHEGGLSAR